jgi:hypothetical protein
MGLKRARHSVDPGNDSPGLVVHLLRDLVEIVRLLYRQPMVGLKPFVTQTRRISDHEPSQPCDSDARTRAILGREDSIILGVKCVEGILSVFESIVVVVRAKRIW